jgi:hypothetical protein
MMRGCSRCSWRILRRCPSSNGDPSRRSSRSSPYLRFDAGSRPWCMSSRMRTFPRKALPPAPAGASKRSRKSPASERQLSCQFALRSRLCRRYHGRINCWTKHPNTQTLPSGGYSVKERGLGSRTFLFACKDGWPSGKINPRPRVPERPILNKECPAAEVTGANPCSGGNSWTLRGRGILVVVFSGA